MKLLDYLLFAFALLLLAFILVIKNPVVVTKKPFDITPYTDSIKKLNVLIAIEEKKMVTYVRVIDSLKLLPPKIKIKYREQKSKVPTATVIQLDSIIRTNAGLPQR